MPSVKNHVTVMGAGAYGTALAITIARSGRGVVLWDRDSAHIAQLRAHRTNSRSLPNIIFPPSLSVESDLAKAVGNAPIVLLVIPSHAFGKVLEQLKAYLKPRVRLAWATKGLEVARGRLLQEVAYETLSHTVPLAVLSGPTFARELAMGLPTAVTIAATDESFATDLQILLHCNKHVRVYSNSDFIGVQLGGAVKNVIAIGAGISDGMGFGANARAALITRGLAEMTRLGVALGAASETFMGMSGLGDLVLTCCDDQSRNRRFGVLLGQGKNLQQALQSIGQLVEGYSNTKEVWTLAQRYGVEIPIIEQIYQVLYLGKDRHAAAQALLNRPSISEN